MLLSCSKMCNVSEIHATYYRCCNRGNGDMIFHSTHSFSKAIMFKSIIFDLLQLVILWEQVPEVKISTFSEKFCWLHSGLQFKKWSPHCPLFMLIIPYICPIAIVLYKILYLHRYLIKVFLAKEILNLRTKIITVSFTILFLTHGILYAC